MNIKRNDECHIDKFKNTLDLLRKALPTVNYMLNKVP